MSEMMGRERLRMSWAARWLTPSHLVWRWAGRGREASWSTREREESI